MAEGKRLTCGLWIVQGLLALTFLFAGGTKLVLPIEEMTKEVALPGLFLRLLGVAEVLGALGLILPGLLRIQPGLTPLAAAGLVLIMIGATIDHAGDHGFGAGADPPGGGAPDGVRRVRPLAAGAAPRVISSVGGGDPARPFGLSMAPQAGRISSGPRLAPVLARRR